MEGYGFSHGRAEKEGNYQTSEVHVGMNIEREVLG